jgi:hypothetical protein
MQFEEHMYALRTLDNFAHDGADQVPTISFLSICVVHLTFLSCWL